MALNIMLIFEIWSLDIDTFFINVTHYQHKRDLTTSIWWSDLMVLIIIIYADNVLDLCWGHGFVDVAVSWEIKVGWKVTSVILKPDFEISMKTLHNTFS